MKKDWIARELTIEIIVGTFMVMILLALGFFTIMLSSKSLFSRKMVQEVCFKNVMGLREGDSVVCRGMTVGKIKDMRFQEGSDRVRVIVTIDEPIQMRLGYTITIVTSSILGGRYLEIDEGSGDPVPDGHLLQGVDPLDMMNDAAEIVRAAKVGVIEGKMIDNFVDASKQLKDIAERLNAGEGIIGGLMTGDSELYRDVNKITSSLRKLAEGLEKGEGLVGKLLTSKDTLYDDAEATVASLKEVAQRLEEGKGTLGRLLSEEDQIYKDLAATSKSLRNVAEKIEKGEGAIGRLVADEELYDDVKGVVGEARAAIDDFRETSPIVTFTSIFFGAF